MALPHAVSPCGWGGFKVSIVSMPLHAYGEDLWTVNDPVRVDGLSRVSIAKRTSFHGQWYG